MKVNDVCEIIRSTLSGLNKNLEGYIERIKFAGWDTDIASLETSSGTRIKLSESMPDFKL